MSPIRVLHFAKVFYRYDFVDTVIRHANPSQFTMMACTLSVKSNMGPPDYTVLGIPQWVLPGQCRREYPFTILRLARLLQRVRVDILHIHHYDEAIIGWLATRIHRKTRLVVGRHYSDAIYRLPSSVKRRVLKQRALLSIEQAVNRAATRIIVPSAQAFEILTKWQGINPEKVDLIPYGFEPEKYVSPPLSDIHRVREELGLNGRFVLATFGRLQEEKGHRFLLEAVAQLKKQFPHLLLLLAGEGPERPAIESQIQEAGLQNVVRLLGWRRDAMLLMAAVDAVVQPTLHEAFSQVMVEALWLQKPLIITDVSGAPDIIRDGENGLLVPRGNAIALAHAIARLACDAALRTRIGSMGRTYVEEHLSINKIIHLYEQAYMRAMEV